MQDLKNPIAELERSDSGLFIIPSQAKELHSNPQFYCIDSKCLDPERRLYLSHKDSLYFFSHYPGFEHVVRPQTILHKLAIQFFKNLNEFQLPAFEDEKGIFYPVQKVDINTTKTVLEYNELSEIRPDVFIITNKELAIATEIFVTHEVDETKHKKLTAFKLPTIEIDLSKFYEENREQCKTDIEFVRGSLKKLLSDIDRKIWRIKPLNEQAKGKLQVGRKSNNCWIWVALVAIFLYFAYLFRRKR